MKLVCPNCGAQYAVDDRMIPPAGRDVQCSNCAHTWFQPPADQDTALAEELGYQLDEVPSPVPAADTPPAPPVEATPAKQDDPAPVAVAPAPAAAPPQEAERTGPPAPPKRARDERVFNVLREEAAREQAARAREAQSDLESQPELDIAVPSPKVKPRQNAVPPVPREMPASKLLDHSEEAQMAAAASLAGRAATRRDLLPDIEEINSTLQPAAGEGGQNAPGSDAALMAARQTEKSGFRMGFSAVAVCTVFGLGLYLHAPKVARLIPATETALRGYVDIVDRGRIWLDHTLINAIGESQSSEG